MSYFGEAEVNIQSEYCPDKGMNWTEQRREIDICKVSPTPSLYRLLLLTSNLLSAAKLMLQCPGTIRPFCQAAAETAYCSVYYKHPLIHTPWQLKTLKWRIKNQTHWKLNKVQMVGLNERCCHLFHNAGQRGSHL